jgi:putative ubiquitin-RnfH superfamily antitoxin RatB of RatAB toxin-antitoxin module
MQIEIAYAKPNEQVILVLDVSEGATVETAIIASGMLQRFPEIDLGQNKVGIFSKLCKLDHLLRAGDRVEIYRPLLADPKQARRNRAAKH